MWRPSMLLVVLKRLLANIGIVSFNIFGLLLTVALMCSIPLYAEGVNEKLLQEELSKKGDGRLPRSNLFFRYLGGAQGSVDLRRYEAIDGYLAWAPEAYFGFPMLVKSRYVGSDLLKLYPTLPE